MTGAPHLHRSQGNLPSHLAVRVARNVKRLRGQRGYSLEQLAEIGKIDVPALGKLEAGEGNPSLSFAWRVAHALKVPFTALTAGQAPRGSTIVRYANTPNFVSGSLGLSSRSLLPYDETRGVEFYEITLAPNWSERFEPHAPGTSESIHVGKGSVEIVIGREEAHVLNKGDTISYPADLAHSYRNLTGESARLYLVITYGDTGPDTGIVRGSHKEPAPVDDETAPG